MIFTATMLMMASASPEIDCTKASSTPDLRYCAALDLEAADEAMTKQWNEISAYMKQEDARYDKEVHIREDDGPGYHETLLASQRAWITYREQACQLSGYMFRGGTMEPLEASGCMTKMAEARTKELAELLGYYKER